METNAARLGTDFMSLRGTGAGEGHHLRPKVSLPGGSTLARWCKLQLGFSVGIDGALHRLNPWSVSARSENLQLKHGANESAYDTARGREAKNKVQHRAHEVNQTQIQPERNV